MGGLFGGGGGGGSAPAPAPSSQTVTQTAIPEYARPYVETMLGKSEALTNINQNPYQNYGGQRIAEFNPTQLNAFNAAINQTPASQLGSASDLATQAGYGGLNMAGQSAGLQNQALGYGQAGSMYGNIGQMYGAQGARQAQLAAQNAQRQAQMFSQGAVSTGQQSLGYGAQGAGYGQGAQQFGLSAAELAAQQGLGYGAQGAGYGAQAAGLAPQAQRYGAEAADVGREGLGYGRLGAEFGAQAAGLAPTAQVFGQEAADIGASGEAGARALAEQVARQSMGYGSQLAGSSRLGLRAGEEMGAIGSQGLGYGAAGAGFGGAAASLAPVAQQYGQGAADIGLGGLGYGALGAGFGGRGAQAAEQGFGAGEAFARQATSPAATQAYMSPYMQNVVDAQKSEATRDYLKQLQAQKAQAVGKGAFGGSRQAIAEAEAQRSLNTQLQNIQATGTQKAFEDAQRQQQFGAQLGVQGLQAGYGGLGLGLQGAQTGLSGLGTAMQGQQAGLAGLGQAGSLLGQGIQGTQAGLAGLGTALQGQQGRLAGLSAYQQGLQGAQSGLGQALGAGQLGLAGTQQSLAGQQARLNALGQAGQFLGQGMQGAQVGMAGISPALQGLQSAQAGLGQAGQLYGQGMQGAQTGLQGLQGALAGSAQGLQGFQTGLQGSQAGMQGVQGALQGYNTGLSGVGQQLGAGQLGLQGTAQGMQGAQAGMQGAQSGLQGVQGAIGAGQYGLQGLGTAGTAASQLGQLGQTQFGQEQAISAEQQKIGAIQQAQAQQAQDLAYQDFLKQKNYPYQQLAFMSDMLRGLPLSQSAQQVYTAPPNMGSQLGGLGMSALGIYGASGGFRAKGGMVGKGYAEGGLMAAKAYKEGGYASGGDIAMMNVKQLTEMLDNPTLTPLEVEMVQKRIMLLNRMANNPATAEIMGQGIDSIPTGEMVPEQMAGGGIVAFKDGGKSDEDYRTFLESQVRKSIENQMSGDAFSRSAADKAKVEKGLKEREENRIYELMANIGAGTAAGTSQYGLSNLGAGVNQGVKTYGQTLDKDAANQLKLLEAQLYADKAEDARRSSLTGQMTTSLGQLYGRDATLAASRASAGDPELKLIQRAQALINNNDEIPALIKQRDTYAPGSKEYNAFNAEISAIRNAIFKEVGVKRPTISTPGVQLPPEPEKKGFFSGLFGGSKAPASQNKVVPFNLLPS